MITAPSLPPLIAALLRGEAYPHPVQAISLAETHISWVLLTGDYAYKIKKPVKLPFLDFSTLEQRRCACGLELQLNRRFAPQLYEAVVPISGDSSHPLIGGSGEAFEYAVRMRQFNADDQLDRRLSLQRLTAEDLEQFGHKLARLHAAAKASNAGDHFGTQSHVCTPVHDTLNDLQAGVQDVESSAVLKNLTDWCSAEERRLREVFARRKSNGFIREGHGDLHLANLVYYDGAVVPFDCIEFSDDLRWNDVISDAAFLVMDLMHRNQPGLAYRFLNAYLEDSGDYDGVAVLPYYLVYRALVRAKVEIIRAHGASVELEQAQLQSARTHIQLAARVAMHHRPRLILMHGLSGSGKSWVSEQLAPELSAIRLRSDVERKRLHGLSREGRSASAPGEGIYGASSTAETYQRLVRLAEIMLTSGATVIVDACFLKSAQRQPFLALARKAGARCHILDCQAPLDVLETRLTHRARMGHDPSEADTTVLALQRASSDPLNETERAITFSVSAQSTSNLPALLEQLRQESDAG